MSDEKSPLPSGPLCACGHVLELHVPFDGDAHMRASCTPGCRCNRFHDASDVDHCMYCGTARNRDGVCEYCRRFPIGSPADDDSDDSASPPPEVAAMLQGMQAMFANGPPRERMVELERDTWVLPSSVMMLQPVATTAGKPAKPLMVGYGLDGKRVEPRERGPRTRLTFRTSDTLIVSGSPSEVAGKLGLL